MKFWVVQSTDVGCKKDHKELWSEVEETWNAGNVPTMAELDQMKDRDTSLHPFPCGRSFQPGVSSEGSDVAGAVDLAQPPPLPPADPRPPKRRRR